VAAKHGPLARVAGLGKWVDNGLQLLVIIGVLGINEVTAVPNSTPDTTDTDEFVRFMQAYQDMVFSTAARLTGNDVQAEDIAQEVFLKAYENFAQLRASASAGGWLKTVATNLTLNHLSRYRRRWRFFSELRRDDADDDLEFEFADASALPDASLEDIHVDERQVLIQRALSQLPDHQRVPLVLYHFEDMPYEQIARQLHVSLAKVKTDIRRARIAMAESLLHSGLADVSATLDHREKSS
jgi:RNA polymerase sigma-70 factor, ECF subfamily